jgi:hypothetical protein
MAVERFSTKAATDSLKFIGVPARSWRYATGSSDQRTTPAPELIRVAAWGTGYLLSPSRRQMLLVDRLRLLGVTGLRPQQLQDGNTLLRKLRKAGHKPAARQWGLTGEWPLSYGSPRRSSKPKPGRGEEMPPAFLAQIELLSEAATLASNLVAYFPDVATTKQRGGAATVNAAIKVLDLAHRHPDDERFAALLPGGNLDPFLRGVTGGPCDLGVRKTFTITAENGETMRCIDLRVFLPFVPEVLDLRSQADDERGAVLKAGATLSVGDRYGYLSLIERTIELHHRRLSVINDQLALPAPTPGSVTCTTLRTNLERERDTLKQDLARWRVWHTAVLDDLPAVTPSMRRKAKKANAHRPKPQ